MNPRPLDVLTNVRPLPPPPAHLLGPDQTLPGLFPAPLGRPPNPWAAPKPPAQGTHKTPSPNKAVGPGWRLIDPPWASLGLARGCLGHLGPIQEGFWAGWVHILRNKGICKTDPNMGQQMTYEYEPKQRAAQFENSCTSYSHHYNMVQRERRGRGRLCATLGINCECRKMLNRGAARRE